MERLMLLIERFEDAADKEYTIELMPKTSKEIYEYLVQYKLILEAKDA